MRYNFDDMLVYILLSILSFGIGLQVHAGDLKCFSRRINYKIGHVQIVTVLFVLALSVLVFYDISSCQWDAICYTCVAILLFSVLIEWILCRINAKSFALNILVRVVAIIAISYFLYVVKVHLFLPFLVYGLYIRNCPLGVVCGKGLFISSYMKRKYFIEIKAGKNVNINFPDFWGCSGMKYNETSSTIYDVSKYGILPNSQEDMLEKTQSLINKVGENGGGVVFFPKGKYYFNKTGNRSFLQINHSHISIQGETDKDGYPLAELVCCNDTLSGEKNPWLSPFFITTGEALQISNMFFGLQFKARKNIITRSGSLADPGSDGKILTPRYATKIISDALEGSDVLEVADSSVIGKYIMIGMYNTSEDGNLIKEILRVDHLRPEWKTALRAGNEIAPSFQWLVEVREILSKTKIRLVRPLLRKIETKYDASIFNVDMLEDISIQDIKISSRWNGMFRHHGFPIYYSVTQAQKMDYGWNGINMKRVAHGKIENVVLENFTNPLYVMDSRNISCKEITIRGYDGHQGIKIYGHACDNSFENITFYNHFADMLGGEGNAYGNVFSHIYYLNPCYKPVDFDFHGFSEGPFSPPAYNLFECIYGFRHIKTAAAMYNLPGCAQFNVWWNIMGEGEKEGTPLFICLPYVHKKLFHKILSSISRMIIVSVQNKSFNPKKMVAVCNDKAKEMETNTIEIEKHQSLYHNIFCIGFNTTCKVYPQVDVFNISQQDFVSPISLFKSQQKTINQ